MAVFNGKINFLEHQKLFLNGVEAFEKEILDKSRVLSIEMRSEALSFIEELEESIGKHIGICDKSEMMAKKIIELAEKFNIVKSIDFKKVEDNRYAVTIDRCILITNESHPRLNASNRVCPFAMMISAVMKCALQTENIIVEPTHFTPQSSKTKIDIL